MKKFNSKLIITLVASLALGTGFSSSANANPQAQAAEQAIESGQTVYLKSNHHGTYFTMKTWNLNVAPKAYDSKLDVVKVNGDGPIKFGDVIAIKSNDGLGRYVTALNGQYRWNAIAYQKQIHGWERFTVVNLQGQTPDQAVTASTPFALRGAHGRYLMGTPDGYAVVYASKIHNWESLSFEPVEEEPVRGTFKAKIGLMSCGLEWSGQKGGTSGIYNHERVAKVDCFSSGDPFVFDEKRNMIYAPNVDGKDCYLRHVERPGGAVGSKEYLAKFDCRTPYGDPVRYDAVNHKITTTINGKECGLQWNGSTGKVSGVSWREHVAKFDCESSGDEFKLINQTTFEPPVAEACADGYSHVNGDIPGSGSINGKGGFAVVGNADACADLCDSEDTCASYEFGFAGNAYRCNLNTSAEPTTGDWMEMEFCVKDPESKTEDLASDSDACAGVSVENLNSGTVPAACAEALKRAFDFDISSTGEETDTSCAIEPKALLNVYREKIGAAGCLTLSDTYTTVSNNGDLNTKQLSGSFTTLSGLTAEQCIAECVDDCVGVTHDTVSQECRVNTGDVDGLVKGLQVGIVPSETAVFYVNPKNKINALDLSTHSGEAATQAVEFASSNVLNTSTFFGALGANYLFGQDETAVKEFQYGWNDAPFTAKADLPMPCATNGDWSVECNDADESILTYVEPPTSGDRIVLAQPGANGQPNQRIQQHAKYLHDNWVYKRVQRHINDLEESKRTLETTRAALQIDGYLPNSQRAEATKINAEIQRIVTEISRIRAKYTQPTVDDYIQTATDSQFYYPTGMDVSGWGGSNDTYTELHNKGDDGWLFTTSQTTGSGNGLGAAENIDGWTIEYGAHADGKGVPGVNLDDGDTVQIKATCNSSWNSLNAGKRVITAIKMFSYDKPQTNPCWKPGYELVERFNGSNGTLRREGGKKYDYMCVYRMPVEEVIRTDKKSFVMNSLRFEGTSNNCAGDEYLKPTVSDSVAPYKFFNHKGERFYLCYTRGTATPPLTSVGISAGNGGAPSGNGWSRVIRNFNVDVGGAHPQVYHQKGESCARVADRYLKTDWQGTRLKIGDSEDWVIKSPSAETWNPSPTGQRVVFQAKPKRACGSEYFEKDAAGNPISKPCYLSRKGGVTTNESDAIFNMYWDIDVKHAKGNVQALYDVHRGARDWKEATETLHKHTQSAAKLSKTMGEVSTEIDNLNDALDTLEAFYKRLKHSKKTRPVYRFIHSVLSPLKRSAEKVKGPARKIATLTSTLDDTLQPTNRWLEGMKTTSSTLYSSASEAMEARETQSTESLEGCSNTLDHTNDVFLRPFGWVLKETGSVLGGSDEGSAEFNKFKNAVAYINTQSATVEGDMARLLAKLKFINNILNPFANFLKVTQPLYDNFYSNAVAAVAGKLTSIVPIDEIIDPLIAPLTAKVRQWIGFDFDFSGYQNKLDAIEKELESHFREAAFDLPVAEMDKLDPKKFMKDKEKVKALKSKVSKASKGFAKDKAKETIEAMIVDFAEQKLNDMTDGCLSE